jgi:hypothetical protein
MAMRKRRRERTEANLPPAPRIEGVTTVPRGRGRSRARGALPTRRAGGIAAGEITLAFRRWDRPRARVGARLDAASRRGPWTGDRLRLVQARPGVRAAELAAELGLETQPFKRDVRKLKEIGLTESLEVGYRLSPRGPRS